MTASALGKGGDVLFRYRDWSSPSTLRTAPERLALLRRTWMTGFGPAYRAAPADLDRVLVLAAAQGGTTVAAALELLASGDPVATARALRGLGWLLKFDVLRRA